MDAAVDGDVLLVKCGTYAAFELVGTGLSVVADSGADVLVIGATRVADLAPGQLALLSGLGLDGEVTLSSTLGSALVPCTSTHPSCR